MFLIFTFPDTSNLFVGVKYISVDINIFCTEFVKKFKLLYEFKFNPLLFILILHKLLLMSSNLIFVLFTLLINLILVSLVSYNVIVSLELLILLLPTNNLLRTNILPEISNFSIGLVLQIPT